MFNLRLNVITKTSQGQFCLQGRKASAFSSGSEKEAMSDRSVSDQSGDENNTPAEQQQGRPAPVLKRQPVQKRTRKNLVNQKPICTLIVTQCYSEIYRLSNLSCFPCAG